MRQIDSLEFNSRGMFSLNNVSKVFPVSWRSMTTSFKNINRKGVTSFWNRKRCVTTTEAAAVVAAVTARSKQKKTSSSSLERGKPLPPSFAKARPLSLPFLTSTAASTSFSSSSFTTTSTTTAILWTWENESASPRTPIFCQTIWPSSLPWTARESETEREEVRVCVWGGGGEGGGGGWRGKKWERER